MQDLSLHILDIAENSIIAGAKNIEIQIVEDMKEDLLIIEITDDGKGMDPEISARATDPFVSTRKERRVGLGLSLFEQAARMSNGDLTVCSNRRSGTRVRATFQHSHIDRKPMGDIGQTIITLVMGNPEIDLVYKHKKGKREYSFDTKTIRAQLEDWSTNIPQWIKFVEKNLKDMQKQLMGVRE